MRSYTVPVEWDGDEAYITFPQEEMERLGWEEGDVLSWDDNGDGSFTVSKKQKDFVSKILQFNRLAGKMGEEFDARDTSLYIGLILEEVAELIESIPDQDNLGRLRTALEFNSRLFKQGFFDKQVTNIKRTDALDACVDIAVVAIGGGHALGADVSAACNNVANSNLSKAVEVDGVLMMQKDENGKVIKPPTYKPPSLEQFLK